MKGTLGIDVGSRTIKAILLENGAVTKKKLLDTGHDPLPKIKSIINEFDPGKIIATGYGRHMVGDHFPARKITEITACARGTFKQIPSCRTILDVGGQDCKVIAINENGKVQDFEMNDRCAAGTGKFIEIMAGTFEMKLENFIQLAQRAKSSVPISSMCAVFAESEVVGLITSGKPKDAIARGVHEAIAQRLASMLNRISPKQDVVFVGGGANNDCLHSLLEIQLKQKIVRPAEPQFAIALGAALLE